MKKIISIMLVLVVLATVFVGCTKECESCGKEYKGKTYKVEAMGEKYKVCEDCKDFVEGVKDFAENLGGYEDLLG